MAAGFVVMEIGWEYDDESYSRPRGEGGQPVRVYRRMDSAIAEAEALNQKKQKANEKWPMTDGDDKPITDFYEVVTVEMED